MGYNAWMAQPPDFQLDRRVFDWRDPLVRFGAYVSCAWLIIATLGLWQFADWSKPLKPNEWGDMAAGLAAPMAFLWLVLGFVQQGKELGLQIKELRKTVEHQEELVKATREQVELERAARQPRFVLLSAATPNTTPPPFLYYVDVTNQGPAATNVRFEISVNGRSLTNALGPPGYYSAELVPPMRQYFYAFFATGQREQFTLSFHTPAQDDYPALTIQYTDMHGAPARVSFRGTLAGGGGGFVFDQVPHSSNGTTS